MSSRSAWDWLWPFEALAGAAVLAAKGAAQRRSCRRLRIDVLAGILLLIRAVAAARFGPLRPDAFMPNPKSNCTYGFGASAKKLLKQGLTPPPCAAAWR